MIFFCDNKLCRLHLPIEGPQFDVITYKEANGNKCRARRLIIRDDAKKIDWAFCEICANSVAMVNNP